MNDLRRFACLTFHTERLHDDKVWKHVSDVARFLSCQGISATWFSIAPVHPAYIEFSPSKWAYRLKELSSENQLVEQHTHFYRERKGQYDLSWANLEKRLLEDKNWLESHGFQIKGFVAGGWAVTKELFTLLVRHDYVYDCSIQASQSISSSVTVTTDPVKFISDSKYLVEIPTSSRLSLKYGLLAPFSSRKSHFDNLEFIVFYLHDYDLTQFLNRIALKTSVALLSRRYKFITIRELIGYFNLNHLPVIDLKR